MSEHTLTFGRYGRALPVIPGRSEKSGRARRRAPALDCRRCFQPIERGRLASSTGWQRSVRLGGAGRARTKALTLWCMGSQHGRSVTSPVRYMPGAVGLSFSRVCGPRRVTPSRRIRPGTPGRLTGAFRRYSATPTRPDSRTLSGELGNGLADVSGDQTRPDVSVSLERVGTTP
jgi:hypothetical protein